MLTKLLIFDRHYLVCCKWSDALVWSVVECIDFDRICWG